MQRSHAASAGNSQHHYPECDFCAHKYGLTFLVDLSPMFLLDYRTRAPESHAALPPVLSRSAQHRLGTRSHSEPAVSLAHSSVAAKGTVSALELGLAC